jgi:hypothetical protein
MQQSFQELAKDFEETNLKNTGLLEQLKNCEEEKVNLSSEPNSYKV